MWTSLLIVSCLVTFGVDAKNHSIHLKLRDDTDLSEFYSLLVANEGALPVLNYRNVTVFAPTNHAFQKADVTTEQDTIIFYHIANTPLTLHQLTGTINTELDGNPPLWVTRYRTPGRHGEDVYINNARVIHSKSNVIITNSAGKKQVLHVLDEVLKPVWPIPGGVVNPNAYQFMNISESLNLDSHRLRTFRHRVNQMEKQDEFSQDGKFTFFIPVDEGFLPDPRPDKIDAQVIDGHIIPGHVLFTTPTPDNHEYKTLAFNEDIKVVISFSTESSGREIKKYIKSNTLVGDAQHPSGVVMAEIVKANIPVKNGVVHLIHRPLMVVDTTVSEFLESFKVHEDGPLYKFYEVIRDVEGDFMDRLTRMKELTLFAPTNNAWKDPNLNNIIRDKRRIQEILNMHVVMDRKLSLESIVNMNMKKVPTMSPKRQLYFNVVNMPDSEKVLSVEGGGVNSTVIQPDIAATNGIVHMIDRVLGVPFTTVWMKLKTDPMLNKTFTMGESQGFNDQLNDTSKRFTYFVPRDYAWNKMETKYPSVHKKLFMKNYAYHARQILERHLVITDTALSMAELMNLTINEAKQLRTVRDNVKIKVRETDKSEPPVSTSPVEGNGTYYIQWNSEWIHVFRPDVECTNGVIHVIDDVLLQQSDITVTGGAIANGGIVGPIQVAFGFLVCLLISHRL